MPNNLDGQHLKYNELLQSRANVTNGTHILVPATECARFDSIVGLCKSDVALTLNVYQGSGLDDADMEYVTAVSVPADTTEGAGAAFSVAVIGLNCRVDVVNAGSTTTSFKCSVALRAWR